MIFDPMLLTFKPSARLHFAGADVYIVVPIHGDVGGESGTRRDFVGIVAGEIGIHVAHGNGSRETLRKHA